MPLIIAKHGQHLARNWQQITTSCFQ